MTQAMPRQVVSVCIGEGGCSGGEGGCSVKSGFTGALPGKTFWKNWQCFESVSFLLYQFLASRDAFLPICHTGVAFVSRVSCVILTLAVVVVLVVV